MNPDNPETWTREQLERGIIYYQNKLKCMRTEYETIIERLKIR